jgi:hypothetical protein
MNLRKQRQRLKKRNALNDERLFGTVYSKQDPTARMAISRIKK